jgi:transposase
VPDHSTFSKNRHGRFRDSDTLRFVFEQVLERCVREGVSYHAILTRFRAV